MEHEYYESAQTLIVREDDTVFVSCQNAYDIINVLSNLNMHLPVGAQTCTMGYMFATGDESFGFEKFENVVCLGYITAKDAMLALSEGKIDAVIVDERPGKQIAETVNVLNNASE